MTHARVLGWLALAGCTVPHPTRSDQPDVDKPDTAADSRDTVDPVDTVDTVDTVETGDTDDTGNPPDPSDMDGDGILAGTGDCDDADPLEPVIVDAGAMPEGADGTAAHPLRTIQAGIDLATGCVAVMPGRYEEVIDFGGKDLVVFGYGEREEVILDGQGEGAVVRFHTGESRAAELRGFTISGGRGMVEETEDTAACPGSGTCIRYHTRFLGGGVYVDGASPTLRDLMITGNLLNPYAQISAGTTDRFGVIESFGGGIFVTHGEPDLRDVDLATNYADQGGGIYVATDATVSITHSRIGYNTAAQGGGIGVGAGTLTATNVVLTGNTASTYGGGILVQDGVLELRNTTLVTNGGGIAAEGLATVHLSSSIVADNAGIGVDIQGASLTAAYTDAYGNGAGDWVGVGDPTGTSGNLAVDPAFAGFTADTTEDDDLGLLPTSPLLDAGDPDPERADADGTPNAMGAFGGPDGLWP